MSMASRILDPASRRGMDLLDPAADSPAVVVRGAWGRNGLPGEEKRLKRVTLLGLGGLGGGGGEASKHVHGVHACVRVCVVRGRSHTRAPPPSHTISSPRKDKGHDHHTGIRQQHPSTPIAHMMDPRVMATTQASGSSTRAPR